MTLLEPNAQVQKLVSIRVLAPVLFLVGIFGLSLSTLIRNPYTLTYPSAILAGTSLFALLRNRTPTRVFTADLFHVKILASLYFCIATVLFASYYLAGFHRTSLVFLTTFALYLITIVVCLVYPRPVVGLGLICTSGLINRFTAYYTSALYTGVDIFVHASYVEKILQSGSLSGLANNKYLYAPFYHLYIAVSQVLSGYPLQDVTALFAIPVVTIVPCLAIYSLTRKFWDVRVGLIAGLLYIASDFGISWGIRTIPTSIGLVFFSLLLLSLFNYLLNQGTKSFLLFILFFSFVSFTHQFSLFVTMVATVAATAAYIAYTASVSSRPRNIILLSGLVVFLDFVVTVYSGTNRSFFEVVVGQLFISIRKIGVSTRTSIVLPEDPNIYATGADGLTTVQVLGSAILLSCGILGAVYWIYQRNQASIIFGCLGLGSITATTLVITLAGPVVGLDNLLPFRWFGFIYIPLSILAAPGILYFGRQLSHPNIRWVGIIILFLILGPYIVFMGGNSVAGPDGALFDNAPSAERINVQEDEYKLYKHTVTYVSKDQLVFGDRRAAAQVQNYYGLSVQSYLIPYGEPNSLDRPAVLLDRNYLHTKQAQYLIRLDGVSTTVHGPFPLDEVDPYSRSVTYSTGQERLQLLSERREEN